MDTPRLTVALTFDHDSISDSVRRADPPVKFSHAEFGVRVGVPRILELLRREEIPSTWFVPGHTLVTFPASIEAILGGGHELACHGWYHEDFSELPPGEQAAILEHCVSAVREIAGSSPRGHRAPYWALGPETLQLVEAAGFVYDSSLMADDYRLYRVRHGDAHSVPDGTTFGSEGSLIQVPVYWALDDWPIFEPGPSRDGLAAPSRVLEIWLGELHYAHEHAGRPPHRHDAPRVHRARPPDGDARAVHRRGEGAAGRRLRAPGHVRRAPGGRGESRRRLADRPSAAFGSRVA